MIIVDTNILSELMRERPDPAVRGWVDGFPATEFWTTSLTALELIEGVPRLPDGRKKMRLSQQLDLVLRQDFAGRIIPFDLAAAESAAAVAVARAYSGLNVDIRDTQIAGIAVSRIAALATRNTKHFADLAIDLIDHWTHKA